MKSPRRTTGGFTLIELMIVVVIVSILAAIAIPGYQNHVAKTNRRAAEACLSEAAQFLERYYTTNMQYTGAPANPGLGCQTEGSLNTRYTISVAAAADRTYSLTATPTGVQATRDAKCGTLGLDQQGARTVTGSAGAAACW